MKRVLLMLGWVCFFSGCPSDTKTSAKDKCMTVITTGCARIVSCAQKADLLDADYPATELRSDCEKEIASELDCSRAEGVADGYDDCISDLKAADCDDSNDALLDDKLPPPPDSCSDVVLLSN